MGSVGWSFGLEPLPGKRVADDDDIKQALFDFLGRDWRDWIDDGELVEGATRFFGDTLTIEIARTDGVPTEATLWFYLGAEWPVDRVSHWVDVSFAVGRISLDGALLAVGLRALEREGRPFGALTDVLAKACACPLCASVRSNFAMYPVDVGDGWRAEPAFGWASNHTFTWTHAHGGPTCVWVTKYPYAPIVYATRDLARLERAYFPGGEARGCTALVATRREGAPYFVCVLTDAKTRRSSWYGSADGARWLPLPIAGKAGAKAGRCDGLYADPRTPGRLFAWRNDAGRARLFASDDGGVVWAPRPAPPGPIASLARSPHADAPTIAVVGEESRALFALEGGAWRPLGALDFRADAVAHGRTALFVSGTARREKAPGELENAGAVLVRSTDGGATFHDVRRGGNTYAHSALFAHPDGRVFWVPFQIGPLEVTTDDGATWRPVAREHPSQQLLPDPRGGAAVLSAIYEDLYRLEPV